MLTSRILIIVLYVEKDGSSFIKVFSYICSGLKGFGRSGKPVDDDYSI